MLSMDRSNILRCRSHVARTHQSPSQNIYQGLLLYGAAGQPATTVNRKYSTDRPRIPSSHSRRIRPRSRTDRLLTEPQLAWLKVRSPLAFNHLPGSAAALKQLTTSQTLNQILGRNKPPDKQRPGKFKIPSQILPKPESSAAITAKMQSMPSESRLGGQEKIQQCRSRRVQDQQVSKPRPLKQATITTFAATDVVASEARIRRVVRQSGKNKGLVRRPLVRRPTKIQLHEEDDTGQYWDLLFKSNLDHSETTALQQRSHLAWRDFAKHALSMELAHEENLNLDLEDDLASDEIPKTAMHRDFIYDAWAKHTKRLLVYMYEIVVDLANLIKIMRGQSRIIQARITSDIHDGIDTNFLEESGRKTHQRMHLLAYYSNIRFSFYRSLSTSLHDMRSLNRLLRDSRSPLLDEPNKLRLQDPFSIVPSAAYTVRVENFFRATEDVTESWLSMFRWSPPSYFDESRDPYRNAVIFTINDPIPIPQSECYFWVGFDLKPMNEAEPEVYHKDFRRSPTSFNYVNRKVCYLDKRKIESFGEARFNEITNMLLRRNGKMQIQRRWLIDASSPTNLRLLIGYERPASRWAMLTLRHNSLLWKKTRLKLSLAVDLLALGRSSLSKRLGADQLYVAPGKSNVDKLDQLWLQALCGRIDHYERELNCSRKMTPAEKEEYVSSWRPSLVYSRFVVEVQFPAVDMMVTGKGPTKVDLRRFWNDFLDARRRIERALSLKVDPGGFGEAVRERSFDEESLGSGVKSAVKYPVTPVRSSLSHFKPRASASKKLPPRTTRKARNEIGGGSSQKAAKPSMRKSGKQLGQSRGVKDCPVVDLSNKASATGLRMTKLQPSRKCRKSDPKTTSTASKRPRKRSPGTIHPAPDRAPPQSEEQETAKKHATKGVSVRLVQPDGPHPLGISPKDVKRAAKNATVTQQHASRVLKQSSPSPSRLKGKPTLKVKQKQAKVEHSPGLSVQANNLAFSPTRTLRHPIFTSVACSGNDALGKQSEAFSTEPEMSKKRDISNSSMGRIGSTSSSHNQANESDSSSHNSDSGHSSISDSESDESTMGEKHIHLQYQIPEKVLREAQDASLNTEEAYYSHQLYRGPQDQKVLIHYCRNMEAAETVSQYFKDEPVLGFDIEWRPNAFPSAGARDNTSLIQLASESRIALFHISQWAIGGKGDLLPSTLRRILESTEILKVGVSILADSTRLRRYLNVESRGLMELSHLHKLVTLSEDAPHMVNKRLVSLALQAQVHLGLPLSKGPVRESDWSKKLDHKQVSYAATDAYAGLRIWDVLEAGRKKLEPRPPRPAFAELKLPIKLAPGIRAVAHKATSTANTNILESESSEEIGDFEEDTGSSYDTAPEDQEEGTMLGASFSSLHQPGRGNIDLPTQRVGRLRLDTRSGPSRFEVAYPQLPSQTPSKSGDSDAEENHSSEPAASPRDDEPPSPTVASALDAAVWAADYRATRTLNTRLQIPTTGLTAYSYWHHQKKPVDEIAGLLREKPLAESTVVKYLLDCLSFEALEYDVERAEILLEKIPGYLREGRYKYFMKKVKERSSAA